MQRIDRTFEPQEEQKGSGSEDVTEAVVKARSGINDLRAMLLELETFFLKKKRGILAEETQLIQSF